MSTVYSVAQVNTYIKNMFTQDFMLRKISVSGEVSNCKYHRSGHIYFTLKDGASTIACVMFAGNRRGLGFAMRDGDKVVVTGSVEIYERDGRYQLYARSIVHQGAGDLYQRYLALKNELEEMGMFAQEYKQQIPSFAKRIGIVTAPTGAAVQDIRNIALRRNPYVQLILYPALVQGEGAKESISRGIRALDEMNLDVIIVGRGGGSIEDLWAFNEEMVARAIFDCRTPIISAVGHETDTTIADWVADLRAPTPSAAAELAVKDIREIFLQIERAEQKLNEAMSAVIEKRREYTDHLKDKMTYLSPAAQIHEKREQMLRLEDIIQKCMQQALEEKRQTVLVYKDRILRLEDAHMRDARHVMQLYIQKFKGLSPLDRLNSGFSYVETEGGNAVTGVHQVTCGDRLKIRVIDGCIDSVVTGSRELQYDRKEG